VILHAIYWLPLWRNFWYFAMCRHPTSIERPSRDYVTGRQQKPRRLGCDEARVSKRNNRCGPQARYWETLMPRA
jgi:hypothetical protein